MKAEILYAVFFWGTVNAISNYGLFFTIMIAGVYFVGLGIMQRAVPK